MARTANVCHMAYSEELKKLMFHNCNYCERNNVVHLVPTTLWLPLLVDYSGSGSCTSALSAYGNLMDIWAGFNRQGRIVIMFGGWCTPF